MFEEYLDKNGNWSSMKLKNFPKEEKERLFKKWESDSLVKVLVLENLGFHPACGVCGKNACFNNNLFSKWCSLSCGSKGTTKRGQEHHLASPEIRKKIRATTLEKYGVENVTQVASIKAKSAETCLRKYGATSFLGSDGAREKVEAGMIKKYGVKSNNQVDGFKQKLKENSLKKYGTEYPGQADEIKNRTSALKKLNTVNRIIKANESQFTPLFEPSEYRGSMDYHKWKCNKCETDFETNLRRANKIRCYVCSPLLSGTSNLEINLFEWVKSLGVNVLSNDRKIIAPKELDIVLPDQKIAIEVNGNFWHSIGNDGKEIDTHEHAYKSFKSKSAGYELLHFFEDDLVDNLEIVYSIIRTKLGKSEKIDVNRLSAKLISKEEASGFFKRTHLRGKCLGSNFIGLYDGDALLACGAFLKSRLSKSANWEIVRFSTELNLEIYGALEKIISTFRSSNKGSILVKHDISSGSDDFLLKAGFRFEGTNPPDFCYIHRRDLLTRLGKNSLYKSRQLLLEEGYRQLWDCGQSVWVLQ